MQIKQIMTHSIETVNADENLVEAAMKMRSLNVGSLPVCRGNEFVGMITDRDITVRSTAEGKDPNATSVSEVMTPDVYCCYEDSNIYEAADMMEEKSIHRLMVLNEDNRPIGFLSLADFAVKSRDERLAWEILERLSETVCPHR